MSLRMPFGRYKGEDVDAVRQDASYLAWLLRQGWFSQRYPAHHAALAGPCGLSLVWTQVLGPLAEHACIACARPLPPIAVGDVVCTLHAGSELLGVVDERCLTPASKAELARLRAEHSADARGDGSVERRKAARS